MPSLPGVVRRIRALFRRDAIERDLDDELGFHIEMQVEQYIREGLSPEAARRRARLHFGGESQIKEETRDTWGLRAVEDFGRDLRHAARALLRQPGFTVVAVVTLGLGIGASTGIFSLVNAAMMRPLPFDAPDRLVAVWGTFGPERAIRGASHPEIRDWDELNRSFEDVVVYDETTLNLSGRGEAEVLDAEVVSPGFFELLGVAPFRGRVFEAGDDVPGAAPVAIVSHDLWQTRFGGDPDLLGETLMLDGTAATVVGIMPPDFTGLSFDTEVWSTLIPFSPGSADQRGGRWLMALGRLRPDVTLEAAQADMESVAQRLEQRYPDNNRDRHATLFSLRDNYLGNTRDLFNVLLGAVAFLLVIACVNVTNLQLVRGVYRNRETAVRYALGARRGHLIRQRLSEAMVLALGGSVVGLVLASFGIQLMLPLIPDGVLPSYASVRIDARVFAFAVVLTLVTGLVSGMVPALRAAARELAGALRDGGRGISGGRLRLQRALVVGEVAMALALMVGAGLMVRSLRAQLRVDPGFKAENLTAARLFLSGDQYDAEGRLRLVDALLEQVRAIPGVTDVAIGSDSPLRGSSSAAITRIPGREDAERIRYYRHMVTPEYFETLGIPVRRGRGFDASDVADGPGVVVISDAFARRYWPAGDPIGQRLQFGREDFGTIIGVAAPVRYRDLTTNLMDPTSDPDLYFSYRQVPTGSFDIVIRTERAGVFDVRRLRDIVAALDPALPLFNVEPLTDALARQTANGRFGSFLLGIFAALALTLAAVGVYGIMAFMVGIRLREIAIRLAIGAEPRAVLGLVLRQGMTVVAVGAGIGVGVALAGGRLLEGLLFGVQPTDPQTFALVSVVMLAVAALANLVPAHRATRVDPQRVLQAEG